MEKAYNHVNWAFLDWVMDQMGFGYKWGFWIHVCISSASFSMLINGTPGQMFKGERGLRQGDPLSSFLFNIVMEVLNLLVIQAESTGCLLGCKIGEEGPSIILLQFADDSLFFIPNEELDVRNLQCIVLLFEACLGLKVNLQKSKMYAVQDVPNLNHLAEILSCQTGMFPAVYLGLPLGGTRKSKVLWDPVAECVQQCLAGWKG